MNPGSPFSLSDHPECPGTDGDPPGFLSDTVDFEYFRVWLVEGSGYGDGSKGGRPPLIRSRCSGCRSLRPGTIPAMRGCNP